MHKIDGPGHASNLFTAGSAAPPVVQPTEITADWLNAVQTELVNVVQGAGLALDKPDNGQLLSAILILLGPSPGFSNYVINGGFEMWQRGTSFATFTGGVTGYTADRWRHDSGNAANSIGVSMQSFALGQTAVPSNPRRYMRFTLNNGSTSAHPKLSQRVEYVDTLNNQQAVLTFWARKVGGQSITFDLDLVQNFGTGGSPSSAVTTSVATNVAPPQTTWTRYEYVINVPTTSGKTLGADGNDFLEVRWTITCAAGESIEFANVQLERGAKASVFRTIPFALEQARCLRYFEKSWEHEVAAAGGVTKGMARAQISGGVDAYDLHTRFRVEKRATPTMTWFNPDSFSANTLKWNAINKTVTSTSDACRADTGHPVVSGDMGGGPYLALAQWQADAEL